LPKRFSRSDVKGQGHSEANALFRLRDASRITAVRSSSVSPFTREAIYDISLLSRAISIKFGTNISQIRAHYCKGFQAQMSRIKIIATSNAILRRWRHAFWRCGVEA